MKSANRAAAAENSGRKTAEKVRAGGRAAKIVKDMNMAVRRDKQMGKNKEEEHLSDEEIEALLLEPDAEEEDEEEPPIYERKWLKRGIGLLLALILVGNILAFWPQVYSMAAIQFLAKSAQLSQDETIQAYKEAVVVVRAGDSKGTGFNISDEGLIMTNYHVVEGTEHPVIHFADGRSYVSEWAAADEKLDLALLRIDGERLPALELAAETPEPGTTFYVIGNPLFFYRIANEGKLLGWHPVISPSRVMLAAPIYKGNSGSPVISKEGLVIGVVYATTDIQMEGIRQTVGLAVPVQHVRDFLREHGF